ncbi:MAG: tetratricopeptide repeat protein [Gammaproteobacteria bacterium]|nr:MAG: tetratricopeptide repeat protein [Gammaproteobacteria bacterium]
MMRGCPGTTQILQMNNQSPVFDVQPQSFQADVVERSQQVPILLLFWAEQVPPSADARRELEVLIGQYQGKALLGLVDVAQDPTLAQHLRVQGVPSIRVIKGGQIVEQLDGPQPEHVLRALLDQLTLSPADQLHDQLQLLIASGDFQSALQLLQQAINEEPNNPGFRVELADVLVLKGELDEARKVLAGIAKDADDIDRPQIRLEMAEEAAGMPSLSELAEAHQSDPDDLETRYQLAVVSATAGNYELALEHAMAILQQDREFRDDIGRTTMIRIFSLLGKGSDLAQRYRRKMFAFMH